ncbi:MAG: preprotein translocase subunit SecY [Planctomycetes bacterium SM23_32]|nr:MAG: preprotein translocase subunit SecY [Planctomycetes bacterium SM23_32]
MSLFEQMANVMRIRDLRRKILITLGLLAVCRVGVYVPLPGVNVHALGEFFRRLSDTAGGQVLGLVNMFAGGALSRGAIFGLGIMPYISASIIFTLLANVVPSLEALRKEGAAGQRRLNQYTRVATVFICLFQGMLLVRGLYAWGVVEPGLTASTLGSVKFMLTSGMLLMAGTMLLMWLGEQIDQYGIGNGISLIITVNILARMPYAITELRQQIATAESQQTAILKIIVLLALFVAVVVAIIYITRGERRIPVQQQKHVRGPKVYGGQKHYLPLRVNQAGVMPIIFAQSLLMFPGIIAMAAINALEGRGESFWLRFFQWARDAVSGRGGQLTVTYTVLYGALIFFFCYFWTAVMFNPRDMSENLQNYGSFIPGIRPGKRTADYLEGIMNRVTVAGSFFLLAIALMPMIIGHYMNVGRVATFYGGTSILIVVGVTLDVVRRINDHLEMRRYSGFAAGAGGRRRSRRR